MINQRRNYRTYTTNSFHHYHKYPNIIRDVLPFKPNGIWVSDITYIWLTDEQKFCYLFLITDMYSRKIVGYSLREDLSRTGAVISLKMALSQVKDKEELSSCIHHSDRGVQYCCKEYVKILNKYKISISMTENSDPLENAIAERINKTIKEEFTDKKTLSYPTFKEAKIKIIEIVNFYNFERPHRSIEYLVPCKAHEITGELKRMWKSYYRKSNVGVYEA
jgi:putative transposase